MARILPLVWLLLAPAAFAGKHSIAGTVVDRNGVPVDRAIVSLAPGNVQLVTDRDGGFLIDYLRDDAGERVKLGKRTDYTVEIFKPGYHVATQTFYYAKGSFALDRFTLVEETILVTESSENLDPALFAQPTTGAGATYEGQ